MIDEPKPPEAGTQAVHGPGGAPLTRRQFLYGTGGLAALGLVGWRGSEQPHRTLPAAKVPGTSALAALTAATTTSADVYSFVSRPDLSPPRVKVTRYGEPVNISSSPQYIFLATKPYNGPAPGQPGVMIVDRAGRLVWFEHIAPAAPFDFNVQSYHGQPVLTWWQGTVGPGYGAGVGQMADSSYRLTRAIRAGDGLMADLHELNLTSRGTALVTAYQVTTTDLSSIGGSAKGKVLAGHAQEIDLATGKVLFDWDSLDHVGVGETYATGAAAAAPFDYFHINSIAETPDGNLLISARNTWALYKVDRSTGKVLWRLNGKKSDFTMGAGSHFYWQHHARATSASTLSVFDDGSSPPEEKQSRALLLTVDSKSMHVSLAHAYTHPAGFIAANRAASSSWPTGGSSWAGATSLISPSSPPTALCCSTASYPSASSPTGRSRTTGSVNLSMSRAARRWPTRPEALLSTPAGTGLPRSIPGPSWPARRRLRCRRSGRSAGGVLRLL